LGVDAGRETRDEPGARRHEATVGHGSLRRRVDHLDAVVRLAKVYVRSPTAAADVGVGNNELGEVVGPVTGLMLDEVVLDGGDGGLVLGGSRNGSQQQSEDEPPVAM